MPISELHKKSYGQKTKVLFHHLRSNVTFLILQKNRGLNQKCVDVTFLEFNSAHFYAFKINLSQIILELNLFLSALRTHNTALICYKYLLHSHYLC